LEKNISNYKINIDIKSHQFKDKIIDVQTTLSLSSENEDSEKIYTKIVYSTIIEIDGELEDKKSLEEIILIKVPNTIYPEIRSLFVLLFEKSGFKKINIEEKIDFKKLYLKKFTQ
jgi:preprotein translocase subunit SecB